MAEAIADSLVGKVVDLLFGVAKKEISYMWNCSENVETFRDEARKLKEMRGRFQKRIDIAKKDGEDLLDGVQNWMDIVDAQIVMADEFLEEAEANAKKTCFNLRMCGNFSTLRHFGKKALDKAPYLLKYQEAGKTFDNRISVPTAAPGFLALYERKNLDAIDTQDSSFKDIVKSVEDESIQITGIYGIGGVGKTTLAMEVAATVNKIFADVVFVTVSQTVNATKIKKEVEAVAKRIMKGEKILIILDDVWEELKLDELGIPCGTDHISCKILITSRSIDVCDAMKANKICVNSLPIEETLILFKRVVGERFDNNPKLTAIAMKIAQECGGLPLIIQAVGNALKNKSIDIWESAHDRLINHAAQDIAPEIRRAFTHLTLSYDLLENEEAKSCFLLCSMFPEDANIPLERLAYYGVGLEKFNGLDSMEDARNRVWLAVNILKSSCLLLDGNTEFTTKMHDVVPDVALLIASKDKNKFLVKAGKDLTEWQPRKKSLESYTGISLMKNDISNFPNYELYFPVLDILLLQENHNLSSMSDEFVESIKEARVLDMEHNNLSSLPKSMKLLTRLSMLNLGGNRSLHEVSQLGELKDLEILILNHTGLKEIPLEFSQLGNLRQLEVKGCQSLSRIPKGVISKLRWLGRVAYWILLTSGGEL